MFQSGLSPMQWMSRNLISHASLVANTKLYSSMKWMSCYTKRGKRCQVFTGQFSWTLLTVNIEIKCLCDLRTPVSIFWEPLMTSHGFPAASLYPSTIGVRRKIAARAVHHFMQWLQTWSPIHRFIHLWTSLLERKIHSSKNVYHRFQITCSRRLTSIMGE